MGCLSPPVHSVRIYFEFNQSKLSLQNWHLQISLIELPSDVHLKGYIISGILISWRQQINICVYLNFPSPILQTIIHDYQLYIIIKAKFHKQWTHLRILSMPLTRNRLSVNLWSALNAPEEQLSTEHLEAGYRARVNFLGPSQWKLHIPQ